MIVVDTSAVAAVFLRESDRPRYLSAILRDDAPKLSLVSWVEFQVAMLHRSRTGLPLAQRFLSLMPLKIITPDQIQAELAVDAYERFGKGRHPARLNFGDCFSYALAKSLNAPLLFKGDDFGHTDVTPALPL